MVAAGLLLLTTSAITTSANSLNTNGLTVIKTVLEDEPQFPGGTLALKNFISQNLIYPTIAQQTGAEGTVEVGFIVDEMGYIVDVKVIQSVNHYLDQEAIRVVKEMPQWSSGVVKGKRVSTSMILPITFKIS